MTINFVNITARKTEDFLMFCDQTVCGYVTIFTTASNLCVLCSCDFLLMDGTFKSCPRFFTKLYTVFGYANDTYMPLVYAVLSNKDQLTCEFLFGRIMDQCNSVNLTLNPSTVITDFEKAAMNAVAAVFPNAQRRGCLLLFYA